MSQFIENILKDRGIEYRSSGKDYLIRCLNPEHEDNNPSCRINKNNGLTHCFSCGFKTNIFKYFGILSGNSSVKIGKLKDKIKEIREYSIELEMPNGFIPYNEQFRGISTKTLKHFNAFYSNTDEKLQDRIIFPIKDISDKIVAFIGRHVLSNANPKYLVFPSGKQLPLFPSRLVTEDKYLVLVEGIFDMLKLYDNGLKNVTCTFGTDTISEKNIRDKLLPFSAQGIKNYYILFDGDTPGIDAAKRLHHIMTNNNYMCEILELAEDTDPNDLSADSIKNIIEYIK